MKIAERDKKKVVRKMGRGEHGGANRKGEMEKMTTRIIYGNGQVQKKGKCECYYPIR